MTTLQQYQAEIVIDDTTGESFMSQRALARVCEVDDIYIRRLVTATNSPKKQGKVLTPGGLQTATLLNEKTIAAAIAKYNPKLAEKLLVLGVRKLMHELAGWKAAEKPMSQTEIALHTLTLAVENERRMNAVEKDVNRLKQFAPTEDYYTLTAYYNYRKQPWDKSRSAAKDGKELVKLSKLMHHDVKPVHDARYNNVNSYHEEVLREYLGF